MPAKPATVYCVGPNRTLYATPDAIAPGCGAACRAFPAMTAFLADRAAEPDDAEAACLVAETDALAGNGGAAALRAAGVAIPVVLIVGAANPRAVLEALGPGGWAVIDAPVAPDALADAVRRALDYDRWRREAGRAGRTARLAGELRKASAVELAAELLHELSQPLTAINSWAGVCQARLKAGPPDPNDLVEPTDLLVQESRRANRTLRAFRTLTRRAEPDIAAVDLNTALGAVAALIVPDADQTGVTLRLALAPGLPSVAADPVLLDLAIFILCRNALDAVAERAEGAREIVVRSAAAGREVVASVSDTGPGLDDSARDRLFKPVISPKTDGVGLGLAVCRTVVESFGGRLWLESSTRDGANFAFALSAAEN